MKLFIDTSGKKIIFALIDNKNSIISFLSHDVLKDTTKITHFLLEKFLLDKKMNLNDIEEFYITKGPGSFTGVRVGLNIIRSIYLNNKKIKVYTISTFDLLKMKGFKNIYIPFGKNKSFYKKYDLINKIFLNNKIKIINNFDKNINEINKSIIGYEKFDENHLSNLIKNNKFKKIKNPNNIKLIYN